MWWVETLYRGREKRELWSKYGKSRKKGGFKEYFNLGNIVKAVCYCWTRVGERKMPRRFEN